MNVSHRIRTSALALTAAAAIALATVFPASAHINVAPSSTAAGSFSLLTFSLAHGCEESSTTSLTIQIPDGIDTVRPGMNYGWTIETIADDSPGATPVAGEEAAPRIAQVVYTAKEPLVDGFYDSLNVQVALPEDAAGSTLYFPIIQTCEEGETAWIQIPEEGQDGENLEHPAPSVTVTDAVEESH